MNLGVYRETRKAKTKDKADDREFRQTDVKGTRHAPLQRQKKAVKNRCAEVGQDG